MSERLPPLVEIDDLRATPPADVRLIHVAEATAFVQAHLPGALLVEPRALVSGQPPAPGRLPSLEHLEALFGSLGYTSDMHFVVYDDEGGGWAGRFIWTLDVIGHRHWSYLNGGLQAWQSAGLPLEQGRSRAVAPSRPLLQVNGAGIAEVADVLAAMSDPEQQIWDVRSAAEYRGERSGARRAGHIPTALHLDWMHLKDPARDLRLVEGLEALLAAHGIDPARRVITHCQSHHRSGLSYLVGRLLGFREIRAFHGSWAEWGNRDDTPVVTGSEPGTVDGAD